MENSCKYLDHFFGRFVVHENRGIVGLKIGFVKGRLFVCGAIGHIDQSRVKAWFLDGPVPKGIHLFVGLKVWNLLNLAEERCICNISPPKQWYFLVGLVFGGSSRASFGFARTFEFQERRGDDPFVTILTRTAVKDSRRQKLVKASGTRPVLTRIQLEAYRILDSGATNVTDNTNHFLHASMLIFERNIEMISNRLTPFRLSENAFLSFQLLPRASFINNIRYFFLCPVFSSWTRIKKTCAKKKGSPRLIVLFIGEFQNRLAHPHVT